MPPLLLLLLVVLPLLGLLLGLRLLCRVMGLLLLVVLPLLALLTLRLLGPRVSE